MSDKKTNRVSVFFGDDEFRQLCLDADGAGREAADFLRSLWRDKRREFEQALADKLVATQRAHEENLREVDALRWQQAASVDEFRKAMTVAVNRKPWEGRDDAGFPRTVATGDKA